MSSRTLSETPPYIAEVRNSQEVTLLGSAETTFWEHKLRPEKLMPVSVDGRAQLMISAVASRWLGVRFREFLIAVQANPIDRPREPGQPSGLYLLTAYNTSRPFAFIEQRYFQTPYTFGNIEVRCGRDPSMQLKSRSGVVIDAARTAAPLGSSKLEEVWEGAIYLPPRPPKVHGARNLFYAKLCGLTEISPFQPRQDTLRITRSTSDPVPGWLLDSEFEGREWHIRESATHSRSKTYPRA